MIGRKMWLDPSVWHDKLNRELGFQRVFEPDEDGSSPTEDAYEPGRFLTKPELEQLIRKAVEMARERHEGNFFYADYEIVKELMK